MIPCVFSRWNLKKGRPDSTTKLLEFCLTHLLVYSCQASASARLPMISLENVHRLNGAANLKEIEKYYSIDSFRYAIKRASFRQFVKMCSFSFLLKRAEMITKHQKKDQVHQKWVTLLLHLKLYLVPNWKEKCEQLKNTRSVGSLPKRF